MIKKGKIQVYTGNGKGKTTAAIGQVLRILAYGGKACVIQFFKPEQTGEIHLLKKSFPKQVKVYSICRNHPFYLSKKTKQDPKKIKIECIEQWQKTKEEAFKKKYDLIIFDEINIAFRDEFIPLKDFFEFLRRKPESQEWILTGRGAPPQIIKDASLVTEMKEVKHPFKKGLKARKGIEY